MALKKIGALWKKKTKDDVDFFAGELDLGAIGKVKVAVFQAEKKTPGSKEPDANIVLFQDDK